MGKCKREFEVNPEKIIMGIQDLRHCGRLEMASNI